jgi:hypothetical protein
VTCDAQTYLSLEMDRSIGFYNLQNGDIIETVSNPGLSVHR